MTEDTKATKAEKTLFVSDSNQKGKVGREHDVITATNPKTGEVIAVTTYRLFSDPAKKVEMPAAYAMVFTKDEAFVVTDKDGKRIQPVVVKDINVGRIILDENDIIVQYQELTQEALFARCAINSGSQDIKKNTKKDEMIAFLKTASGRKAQAIGVSKGSETVVSEMPAGQLDNMLDSETQGALANVAATNPVPNPAVNHVLHN